MLAVAVRAAGIADENAAGVAPDDLEDGGGPGNSLHSYYCARWVDRIVSVGISKKPRLDHDEQSFIDFGNSGATEYCYSRNNALDTSGKEIGEMNSTASVHCMMGTIDLRDDVVVRRKFGHGLARLRKDERLGYIYLVRVGENRYKVGFAKNPDRRFAEAATWGVSVKPLGQWRAIKKWEAQVRFVVSSTDSIARALALWDYEERTAVPGGEVFHFEGDARQLVDRANTLFSEIYPAIEEPEDGG